MKPYLYIFLFSLISYLLVEINKNLLNLDSLILDYLSLNYSQTQIENYFKFQEKWSTFSYLFVPFFLFFKSIIISSVLNIGTFFYSKTIVTFKQIWIIVIKSEFIFLIIGIFKIVWFYYFQTNYTLEDLQYFYPLSALNIVGYQDLEAWFIYPLQTLNLFELAYWFILAYYIGKIASPTRNVEENKYPVDFGLKIVASSYGSALLLWVCVVMFFTLNNS